MKLTEGQKEQIAKLVLAKAEAIENGTINVWSTSEGVFKMDENLHEFRDDEHFLVVSIPIINERHPYEDIDIMEILDWKEEQGELFPNFPKK